jgi:translocation and assembly module TamB
MRRALRITAAASLAIILLAGLSTLVAVQVLRSEWFASQVRGRIVSEVERATGGRAEIRAFRFDWRTITARVDDFILHGTEREGTPPLFRAAGIEVGLKVISIFRREVDIESLTIDRPELRIHQAGDGSTNLPHPKFARSRDRTLVEEVLRLSINRFAVREGYVEHQTDRVPLNITGQELKLAFDYVSDGPRYRGKLEARSLGFGIPRRMNPVNFQASVELSVEKDRTLFSVVRLAGGDIQVDASGTMAHSSNLDTRLALKCAFPLVEAGGLFRTNLGRGTAFFDGELAAARGSELLISGTLKGHNLSYSTGTLALRGIALNAHVRWEGSRLSANPMVVSAPEGEFRGTFLLEQWSRFRAEGRVTEIPLASLVRDDGRRPPWSALVSGPVQVEGAFAGGGVRGVKVFAQISFIPVMAAIPLEGFVLARYDQAAGTLEFQDSNLETPAVRLEFSGILGKQMRVGIRTRDLSELLPVAEYLGGETAANVPVKLEGGVAEFSGSVTGPLDAPSFAGRLSATKFDWHGRKFDRATAHVEAHANGIRLSSVDVQLGSGQVRGTAAAGLLDWQPAAELPLSASVSVAGVDLGTFGMQKEIEGVASGDVQVSGTQGDPRGEATLRVGNPRWMGESFDRFEAELSFRPGQLDVREARIATGKAVFNGQGLWKWVAADWGNGAAEFRLKATGATLAAFQAVRKNRPGLDARIVLDVSGGARREGGTLSLTRLDGAIGLEDVSAESRRIGSAMVAANTKDSALALRLSADLGGSKVTGGGEWSLGSRQAGTARLSIAPLSFATLQKIWPTGDQTKAWPFSGLLAGSVTVQATGLGPGMWSGKAEISRVELMPTWGLEAAARPNTTFRLRNEGAVALEFDAQSVRIRSARLVGQDTNVEAEGAVRLGGQNPWDLRLRGTVNLELATEFERDLRARGVARIDANIRGALADPQIFGRLELGGAAVNAGDFPNGLEDVRGTLLFDSRRVTIDRALTAKTGGGDLSLSGFLEFGGEEIRYRLQGRAARVRVRYPEGASTLADADLSFTGSSTRSLLAGTVTVLRSGFVPRTDLGTLLGQGGRTPLPSPGPQNALLRGMQFDVKIATAPGMEFASSLTRDLQASADLRLRGSPLRPLLLGRVQIDQGEIDFYGNKYTISRGEISFYNPVRIEPILDMDLETRVRGVIVTINFAGPVDKLNVSYRSDPPLRSNEIVALLAVGRSPDSASSTLAGPGHQSGALAASGNSLLGQALSAPISSRMQRFFGVSRVKIDPQLTGLEGTPQARLTVEQDVSRDVTVTFVTNLNRSPIQQIVRVEWSINRAWSAFAMRDENGLFSIEFQYKKTFR